MASRPMVFARPVEKAATSAAHSTEIPMILTHVLRHSNPTVPDALSYASAWASAKQGQPSGPSEQHDLVAHQHHHSSALQEKKLDVMAR